jgi:hypothetical protein
MGTLSVYMPRSQHFADILVRSERLRKLDLHSDFVKGVCWDPVGNFLATQVSLPSACP